MFLFPPLQPVTSEIFNFLNSKSAPLIICAPFPEILIIELFKLSCVNPEASIVIVLDDEVVNILLCTVEDSMCMVVAMVVDLHTEFYYLERF